MNFVLKKSDLIASNACSDGVEFFNDIMKEIDGSDVLVFPNGWGELESVMLYSRSPNWLAFLEAKKLVPTFDIPVKTLGSDGLLYASRLGVKSGKPSIK
jgi:hypothetical protein